MDIKRIIVGIDFSEESELALRHAVAMARRSGAEVVMVHTLTIVETSGTLLDEYGELLEEVQSEARTRLGALRERYTGQGVVISHIVADGPAPRSLAEAASEIDATITVVGTHGRTGLRRLLLGSVAEKVVRRSEGSVLVVRPGRHPGRYRRILVPTDFSPPAEEALATAVRLAEPGAEIDLVHYWQLPVPVASHYMPLAGYAKTLTRIAADIEAAARDRAAALLERYRSDEIAIDLDVVQGPPAPSIVSRAAGYDLIAMGRRGITGLRRWLVGSVTEATVRHAPCSVLVVRDNRADDDESDDAG